MRIDSRYSLLKVKNPFILFHSSSPWTFHVILEKLSINMISSSNSVENGIETSSSAVDNIQRGREMLSETFSRGSGILL